MKKLIKTVGLYFLGGSVVAHFRIRKYRASKLKESIGFSHASLIATNSHTGDKFRLPLIIDKSLPLKLRFSLDKTFCCVSGVQNTLSWFLVRVMAV